MFTASSKVWIAFVHGESTVNADFAWSLACNANTLGDRLAGVIHASGAQQLVLRNDLIRFFLGKEDDWLLWWDTDMELPETAALDLLEAAEQAKAQMATCLGFMWRNDVLGDGTMVPVPNAFRYNIQDGEYEYIWDYQPDQAQWVDATGLGFTLVHRKAFEGMGEPWHVNDQFGHDMNFCWRLGLGKVLYCTQIKSRHMKTIGIDEPLYRAAVAKLWPQGQES